MPKNKKKKGAEKKGGRALSRFREIWEAMVGGPLPEWLKAKRPNVPRGTSAETVGELFGPYFPGPTAITRERAEDLFPVRPRTTAFEDLRSLNPYYQPNSILSGVAAMSDITSAFREARDRRTQSEALRRSIDLERMREEAERPTAEQSRGAEGGGFSSIAEALSRYF